MIFKIVSYLSGVLTGFALGLMFGQRILNFLFEFIRTRGGAI